VPPILLAILFCDKGPRGGPCVFELADGVRLRRYDPSLFRPGDQGPDALRKVVGYARVLDALREDEDGGVWLFWSAAILRRFDWSGFCASDTAGQGKQ
jgi:hypothetical protein